MHPNTFLKTFWQCNIKPQIFVAMSFDEKFLRRYTNVIEPAIKQTQLKPHRVDLTKTGDSILTDIMDGIAHSRFILADVSTIGKDAETKEGYRNSNVLYEVGIALACRSPQDVLLIRDDDDKFLFDVSTIPHMTLDFMDEANAIRKLYDELVSRLKQQDFLLDARVHMAIASLSYDEIDILLKLDNPQAIIKHKLNAMALPQSFSIPRLLEKQLIRLVNIDKKENSAIYGQTEIGFRVSIILRRNMKTS
jgi:hypothetical protein